MDERKLLKYILDHCRRYQKSVYYVGTFIDKKIDLYSDFDRYIKFYASYEPNIERFAQKFLDQKIFLFYDKSIKKTSFENIHKELSVQLAVGSHTSANVIINPRIIRKYIKMYKNFDKEANKFIQEVLKK